MPTESTTALRIALGTDHAGFTHKEAVKQMLHSLGHETKDFGAFSEDSVDYPEFVRPAAEAVAKKLCDLGVVFGGSGNGEAMAANKIKGVRCALCWNLETAKLAKEHNDANVLSIGQRQVSLPLTLDIVKTWIDAKFEGGRHLRRIEMIDF